MSKLLEINHCRKQFGSNQVLTDLSLSVEEGQVLSIIGLATGAEVMTSL